MSTNDLCASPNDATVSAMLDPIPIYLARDSVRAGIEERVPERSPTLVRLRVASVLHRVADRVEGRTAHPRPATQPAAQR
jgi:hypothetical protein